jgi:DNA polymerase-4
MSQKAKEAGVKTGEVLWQARAKCPDLVIMSTNYERYLRFLRLARKIYNHCSDQVESFGLDECWVDVTNSAKLAVGMKLPKKSVVRFRINWG